MATNYLNAVDYTVMALYATALIGLGFYLQKRASSTLEDYLIGSRSLPWWMLGFSGTAAFLDVAGTMLITSFLFMLGPRGLFVELRGGAVLVLIPMMLWTGKWHRRSGCLTGAEWMTYRFGLGWGGRFAQLAKAISGVVLTIGMLAYLVKGIGLFLSTFLPFDPFVCALGLVIVATLYTMLSGFYGVVFTDVFQAGIIVVAVILVSTLAISRIDSLESHESLDSLSARVTGNAEWTSATPGWQTTMPAGYEAYRNLIALAIIYTLRNLFFGLGAGDDPKYFGAKSDLECSKLSLLWTCLMSLRWPMMMGFAVLGLFLVDRLFPDPQAITQAAELIQQAFPSQEQEWATTLYRVINDESGAATRLAPQLAQLLGDDWREKLLLVGFHGSVNPERIMPAVLMFDIPAGLRGLMLVALIAASMSTFDSEVNKTAGYFTRDIYQGYLRPHATTRELINVTWLFIVAMVFVGFLFAFTLKSVNDVWAWIIMGLGGGLMAPLILRMYWWRFNGVGFAVGTLSGMVAAIIQRAVWPDLSEHWALLILAAIGFGGAIFGSLLSPPTPRAVLENFYFTTLPFGWWGDFPDQLPADLRAEVVAEHHRDLRAVPFALVFQVTIFLCPMLALIGQTRAAVTCGSVAVVAGVGLYGFWFRFANQSDGLIRRVSAWRESVSLPFSAGPKVH